MIRRGMSKKSVKNEKVYNMIDCALCNGDIGQYTPEGTNK